MGKKAFIVDDDATIVELFKHILTRENLEVSEAYDGEEALKKIPEAKPDIIILDLMLPKQGGFQVLKELRQNEITKSIPVMIITGKFSDGTTYEFLRSQPNVKGFYSKPIDPAVFALDIKKVLEGKNV
ncbi:MAG: response regulator [Elusimicrobia bacterium]|nr:response regulator [Elusimicrobiota bacterium]